MSFPSRMDTHELLTGSTGYFFEQQCLQPFTNRLQCDIRTADTKQDGLLDGTRALLLLGEKAFHEWSVGYEKYSLNEQRGCPLTNPYNIPCIATFSVQDAMDIQNYEKQRNVYAQEYEEESEESPKKDYEGKRGGKTARQNFRFWVERDTQKLLTTVFEPRANYRNTPLWRILASARKPENWGRAGVGNYYSEEIIVYPSSQEVIKLLHETKDQSLYLDIETDTELNIRCFGFSFDSGPVYVVPVIRYDYTRAYSCLGKIFRALFRAMTDNTVVVHNSMFDLFVFAFKYHIFPGYKIWDTMLAQHRCFPEIEKSLGHCLSLWTFAPYHKDEGVFDPHTLEQEKTLWYYNGKDVLGMRIVKQSQETYGQRIPGLCDSIADSNQLPRPYLLSALMGMRYDKQKLNDKLILNDRILNQYLRWMKILVGQDNYKKLMAGSKAHSLATSTRKCPEYFHDTLGYPVVKKTKGGGSSLDADAIYKLRLRLKDLNIVNPVLDLCIKFREVATESGHLKFTSYKQ